MEHRVWRACSFVVLRVVEHQFSFTPDRGHPTAVRCEVSGDKSQGSYHICVLIAWSLEAWCGVRSSYSLPKYLSVQRPSFQCTGVRDPSYELSALSADFLQLLSATTTLCGQHQTLSSIPSLPLLDASIHPASCHRPNPLLCESPTRRASL